MMTTLSILSRDARTDLWRAANEILELRGKFLKYADGSHPDLLDVVYAVQDAAFAKDRNDNAGVLDNLNRAIGKTNDSDVIRDIRRLIHALGYDCPAHGSEVFVETTGRVDLEGGIIGDTLVDRLCCAICGEPVEEKIHAIDPIEVDF